MANKVRTSAAMAKVASLALSGHFEDAIIEMLAIRLSEDVEAIRFERAPWIEELAQSLAGATLGNRRA